MQLYSREIALLTALGVCLLGLFGAFHSAIRGYSEIYTTIFLMIMGISFVQVMALAQGLEKPKNEAQSPAEGSLQE